MFSLYSVFSFFYLFSEDVVALFSELFLVFFISFFLLFGVFFGKSGRILCKAVTDLSVLVLFFVLVLYFFNPGFSYITAYSCFFEDESSWVFKTVLVFVCLFCLLLSTPYLETEKVNHFEYPLLVLLSLLGMLGALTSNDYLCLYLSLELQALSFYTLASSIRSSEFATEAGLKYFVLGAVASGFFLFGASLLYGLTGCVRFTDLCLLLQHISSADLEGILLAFFVFFASFLFKIGAVPFQSWVPDVYEGSPLCVTAIFALLPKIALFGVMARLLLSIYYSLFFSWQAPLLCCAVASFFWGSVAALGQGRIKRLLAYGSISHSGFILLSLCSGTLYGVQGMILYLITYVISTSIVFGSLIGLRCFSKIRYLADVAGLSFFHPGVSLAITGALFSVAGIPPILGFVGKFSVFFASLSSSLFIAAFLGVICSMISTFYYLRIARLLFFETVVFSLGSFTSFYVSRFPKELAIFTGAGVVILL